MNKTRILTIIIAGVFLASSLCVLPERAFAADPIPGLCDSYREIGTRMDKELLSHKKSFTIVTDRAHADFLNPYIIYTHCVVDPHSILRSGEDMGFHYSRAAVTVNDSRTYYLFTIYPSYRHSAKQDRKFYKRVKSIAKKARRIKSKKKRVKYINNYLIRKTKYKKKYSTAYDALMRRKGNCSAYSEAFTLIASHAGLSAETVTGDFKKGKRRIPHAWNVVKLGRKWHNLDVTFNDQKKKKYRNRFLLVRNKKFKKSHKINRHYVRIGWTKKHPMR